MGFVTLGSGIVNIVSAAGRSLPARITALREVFPLEFLHISRFLSLLIGFALAVTSINIFKRKKRAYGLVMALSALSVVFHLTKGLDYEEAALSLGLMAVLFLARKNFRVKSSFPDLRSTLVPLGVALAVTLFYGTLGFWLLEDRDFGISFSVAEGVRRTLAALAFSQDPSLIPLTHFASWFLDSLDVISVAALVFILYSLFRPAFYRLKTLPEEREGAARILDGHGRSSLDLFKLAPDKVFYFSASGRAFLSYRMSRSFAVVLGDPAGPEEEIAGTIHSFAQFCEDNDWGVAFYQTLPDFLPLYRQAGFKKMKVGEDAIVDLEAFSLDGKSMKHVRHAVNQFDKSGYRTVYYDAPVADEVLDALAEVSDDWLKIPGRRERGFTVGAFSRSEVRKTPVFAALDPAGRVLAFMNIIRSYAPGETTIDLMRYHRDAPHGVMDTLFVKLFDLQKGRGFKRFSLGLAPLSGFLESEEAGAPERAVEFFLQRLDFIFSFEGLADYKAKFATHWEPRYAMYRNVVELPRMAVALLRISGLSSSVVTDV
ncbi:MAG TPA: phosphatidylglycerol lysyltransferase domain-containing protein [Candidatus Bathyarchaeia archaeon]|nr:phosphatidylglycerol lysyltransferase domain-containing protein [Candidatus Bathyarchaeia archaeon]